MQQAPPRARLAAVCVAVATALIAAAGPAMADHDDSTLGLVGLPATEAIAAIHDHHDDTSIAVALQPEVLPSALPEPPLVVAQRYTEPLDDVLSPSWTLQLGTRVPGVRSFDVGSAVEIIRSHGLEAALPEEADPDRVVSSSDPPAEELVPFGTRVVLTLEPLEPAADDTTTEEPAVAEPPTEEPGAEEPPAEQPRAEEPRAEEPPPVDEPVLVSVPDLSGRSVAEARNLLDDVGLQLAVELVDGDSEAGLIAGQEPQPETTVPLGTTVLVFAVASSSTEPPVLPDDDGATSPLFPATVITGLLGLTAGAVGHQARTRRQRDGIRARLDVRPHAGRSRSDVTDVGDHRRATTVRLLPHSDPGRHQLTEVI